MQFFLFCFTRKKKQSMQQQPGCIGEIGEVFNVIHIVMEQNNRLVRFSFQGDCIRTCKPLQWLTIQPEFNIYTVKKKNITLRNFDMNMCS